MQNPLKFVGVPQTPEPISAVSGPNFTILWGHVEEILQQMHHAIKSHHLVTWCAPNSDIPTTLYFICMCRKLYCKSSAMYNFNLIFYHLSHLDPTRPGHTCKFPDPNRPDPWVGSTVVQLCVKLSGEVLAWLSVWSGVQMICIWSS